MKHIRTWSLILALFLFIYPCTSGFAETKGPITTYEELLSLLTAASEQDVFLISGVLTAEDAPPLSCAASIQIKSADGETAVIRGLHLQDASISFYNVALEDSLHIVGTSHIQLASNVSVTGASEETALSFRGNGTLIIDKNCIVRGGSESAGISIEHTGGDFYSAIDGHVRGGDGENGGVGLIISPLTSAGAIMVSGSVEGGNGTAHGGHALNLYQLDGNAYVTIEGNLKGGSGSIGGDGIQLVAAHDNVNVRIGGKIRGGQGESHGGDALILMNTEDASSFHLSGSFSGGDALNPHAQPGTSLQLVGDSASVRTRVVDCILEEGKTLIPTPAPETPTPTPDVTLLPEITSSIDDVDSFSTPEPIATPVPEQSVTPAPEMAESSETTPFDTPPAEPSEAPDHKAEESAGEATPSEAF